MAKKVENDGIYVGGDVYGDVSMNKGNNDKPIWNTIGKWASIATLIGFLLSIYFYLNPIDINTQNNDKKESDLQSQNIQSQQNIHGETIVVNNNYKENVISEETTTVNKEKNLEKIFIGSGRKFIESLFGTPIIEIDHKELNVIEVNYSFENFYLQFLYNTRGEVQFYSVTSKNVNFKPTIPLFDIKLGNYSFYEFGKDSTYLYSYLTSKHYGYAEYIYGGNSGNYHNYYFGYNSAGVDYGEIYPFTNYENKNELEKFRKTCIPNTFGVGYIGNISDDKLYYEMGIEYYTSRDIN